MKPDATAAPLHSVRIERLVIDGLPLNRQQATVLGRAIEHALARELATARVAAPWCDGLALDRLPAQALPAATSVPLADQVAGSLARLLTQP
jgi:hypothetical protein